MKHRTTYDKSEEEEFLRFAKMMLSKGWEIVSEWTKGDKKTVIWER